jgi:predicted TIM-barrel fold metal-dependent hydrolase
VKIDIFNHIFPEHFFREFLRVAQSLKDMGKRVRNIPALVDLDGRFRVMDEFGEYRQVLSLASPPLESFTEPETTALLSRIGNDGMEELVARYPDRFAAFAAALPMNNPSEAEKELERSVRSGARGFQVFSNVNGRPLDSPECLSLIEEMARRDLVMWLHPARGADFPDYRGEERSKYEIWWTFGWPYETSVAMARLVFAGLFDRWPNFRIITHHMGAMIPYFEGRVGHGWDQLGKRSTDGEPAPTLRKRPFDYFKMFHADTALFGAQAATRCGLDFFGIDRVLFASDTPFEPAPGVYIRETIAVIEALGLSAGEKEQIYHGNAERMLSLRPVA